jgi:hypothetical protein
MRGHLALARIGSSVLLEVLIDIAALHEIAPYSAHRANNNLLLLEGGSRAQTGSFYKNLEQ